jgi:hypothetical protein
MDGESLEEKWCQDIPIRSSSFSSRPYFVKQSWGPWLFLFDPEQEHNDNYQNYQNYQSVGG